MSGNGSQLSRAVRNQTTGVLYVLDEPSIGLHPSNIDGLNGVIRDLLRDGNSVVLVDHDVQVLREADWFIEIGPGSGSEGGTVLAEGTLDDLVGNPASLIAGFLDGTEPIRVRETVTSERLFDHGRIRLATRPLHTVHALDVEIPKGRLTAVTGVSGSGKTTMVLESLVPALQTTATGEQLPAHVASVDAVGHRAGQRRRRHSHRHQRAVHRRHLQRRPRRPTPRLRRPRRVEGPWPDRLGLLLQHRIPALPALRRHRARSRSTSSSCPTSTSPAPTATAPAMPLPHRISGARAETACHCPNSSGSP